MSSQQGSSSSYHQEQFRKPFDEELLRALNDEINRDNEAVMPQNPGVSLTNRQPVELLP